MSRSLVILGHEYQRFRALSIVGLDIVGLDESERRHLVLCYDNFVGTDPIVPHDQRFALRDEQQIA
jgi:hypothetical protein